MENCEHCNGTGVLEIGEFDDIETVKCVCMEDDELPDNE